MNILMLLLCFLAAASGGDINIARQFSLRIIARQLALIQSVVFWCG